MGFRHGRRRYQTTTKTWTPEALYKDLSMVRFAHLHKEHGSMLSSDQEFQGAIVIGTLVIWMNSFRTEFAAKFGSELIEDLWLGYDDGEFRISADGQAVEVLHWLGPALEALTNAYGSTWQQDERYSWSLQSL